MCLLMPSVYSLVASVNTANCLSDFGVGHFSTSVEVSGQLGPTRPVPKCLGSEVSGSSGDWNRLCLSMIYFSFTYLYVR